MKKRTIRYSAFLIAAVLAIGSFGMWAMSEQATATAGVDIGTVPGGIYVNDTTSGNIINGGALGQPGGINGAYELFTIEQGPDTTYSENYTVTLYFANTDNIVDHFRYLNIQFEVEQGGNTAQVDYLTLENGKIQFTVDSADVPNGNPATIRTTGNGSYLAQQNSISNIGFLVDVEEGATAKPITLT